MSLPQNYQIRKGDVVILHAVAKRTARPEDTYMSFEIVGAHASPIVEFSEIVGVHRRQWEPGDVVRNVHDYDDFGEVVAAYEDKVWVKTKSGAMVTFDSLVLEAYEEPAAEPPPAPPFPAAMTTEELVKAQGLDVPSAAAPDEETPF